MISTTASNLLKTEESLDTSSPRDNSQTSSSKISSEQQVEYSERSSSDTKPDLGRDDDSITADDRLEDESFPISDKLDSDGYDAKNRDEEFPVESLDLDTERSDSSMYKVKEREDILDVDDREETGEEDAPHTNTAASFYIGEASGNIITKSAIDQRETDQDVTSEEAVDADGFEDKVDADKSKLDLKLEKEELEYSEKEMDKLAMESKTGKVIHSPLDEPKEQTVVHSPVQPTHISENFEEPVELGKHLIEPDRANEIRAPIAGSQKIAESAEIISVGGHEIDYPAAEPKKAAVVHSPIESLKTVAQTEHVVSQNIKHSDEMNTQPIVHESDKSFVEKIHEADIRYLKDESAPELDLEFSVSPQKPPVVHSPIETHKNLSEEKSLIDDSIDDTFSDVKISQFSEIAPNHSSSSEKQKSSENIFSPKQETSGSSNEDSLNKLGVTHRKPVTRVPPGSRWSATDPESSGSHYESFEKSDSRPLSSDVENLYTTYGNSSEYQTAQDASLVPGSTEYVTAASTLDYSGKTISSHESMKSFDSESSGNLGSVEHSEAETLVPSTADMDLPTDTHNQEFGLDVDENEQRLASLEACSGVLLEDFPLDESYEQAMTNMKRSHEMIFLSDSVPQQPSIGSLDSLEKTESTEKKLSSEEENKNSSGGISYDETKFATSLEDGSVLSMSLSSQSNVDTMVENVHDDMASSFGSSLIGSYEMQSVLKDDVTSTSFDETGKIDSLVMTSSFVKSDDDISSVNTQITTVKSEAEDTPEPLKRTKGHKRNDSTSFLKGMDVLKGTISSDSSLDDEMIVHEVEQDEKKGSESDSDYDRYETEYSRSFKQPTNQGKKKKSMIEKTIEKPEIEIERKKSVPSIETIVEDIMAEVEAEPDPERPVSQNMLDYSNIPDIMITDDPTKYVEDDDEDLWMESQRKREEEREREKEEKERKGTTSSVAEEPIAIQPIKPKTQSTKTAVVYAKETEINMSDELYQELVEKQYQSKMAETYGKQDVDNDDIKADSPTSDSFELVEQPDISDEFVIIEEVAKEADEQMTEGKSLSIAPTKYVKKHDEEVEKIVVKSAPAATNEGSMILQGRHGVAFEFEESPPNATGTESSGEDSNDIDASRKWVEMQLAEQAQNLRYPYEMDRGILEDIKEEDTDLEIGSSRISSFKDSFSSSDFDVLAGKRIFAKEHDNLSMSSLQEFESLEHAISLENRKFHQGSQDSLSNGSFPRKFTGRTVQADEISLASLKEFEGLENACLEAHLLEIRAKEEHALLLSRSDESNKSSNSDKDSNGNGKVTTVTQKSMTIVTATAPVKITEQRVITEFPTQVSQKVATGEIKSKTKQPEEGDDELSTSNLMEVSTDSLDLKQKKEFPQGTSHYGSSDSLEVSKSADVMTSSIDSIEISKDATGKSSKSDSIEQLGGRRSGSKRDSLDSIEMQYALLAQAGKTDRDSIDGNTQIDVSHSVTTSGNQTIETRIITATTSTASSSGYYGGISKDISSDSLNINQSEPELLLTSTESLDLNTSSTNATCQTQTNSQMSGSVTSCDSNTLVDERFGTITSSSSSSMVTTCSGDSASTITTTTTTVYRTIQHQNDDDEILDYSEIFDKDAKQLK